MGLTGKEPWVVESVKNGAMIWVRQWGDGSWWPMIELELDCGLIGIDVCGKRQRLDLCDCAQLRIGSGQIIESESFYDQAVVAN